MDTFKQTFIYLFALVITLSTFIFDLSFFYVPIPSGNKDIILTIAGVLNSTCLITVINFFYGSSKTSKDKTEQINTMLTNGNGEKK